jgi:transcriptional regulator with XRE-family HTH domain
VQSIGRRLRDARERAGLSQEDAATNLDVGRGTVANWEAGRHLPNLIHFRQLLTMYVASPYQILYGSSRMRLSEAEMEELERLTAHASIGLRLKISTVLTLLAVED